MSLTAWQVIWIVLGSLYGILVVVWGIIVWRGRPWTADFLAGDKSDVSTSARGGICR